MPHCPPSRGTISRTILLATALSAERRRGPSFLWVVLFWLVVILLLFLKYGR